MNYRIFVAKKEGFRIESESLLSELKTMLGLEGLKDLLIYNTYDVYGANDEDLMKLKNYIIADAKTDSIVEEPIVDGARVIAYESLPVQYDQRSDAVVQNLMILGGSSDVKVTTGKYIVLNGNINDEQYNSIAKYLINPVENRVKDMETLEFEEMPDEDPVITFEGFIDKNEEELEAFRGSMGFAMSREDLLHVQKYFKSEDRNPTDTELLVLDTYWSDHCRHTTFETELTKIDIEEGIFKSQIEDAFNRYLKLREDTGRTEKEITLMDMATIVGRYFRKTGKLDDQEVSDEINACSIEIEVDEDGVKVPWLLMFKNETHNHPTEIEPFGGAATCVGGAIRDPLSGRAYVYQAMRVTGAADITAPINETLPNKLPQVVISKTASDGYSNYAGQIGLAGTYVREVYHDGFVAKRMELGAVVGAAPKENVLRENPEPTDLILLIGGDTGRDGVGGATGSSVEHTDSSHKKSSSEVQKGNAPIERRIQRLFRNPKVSKLIKKSNDFGAGGVSVAIGELADGLDINLNAVPVKYRGLSGTELAISESQERMAIVIASENLEKMVEFAKEENLNAVLVAEVTDTNRLVMKYNGEKIVDLCRDFLNTNGVRQTQTVDINTNGYGDNPFEIRVEEITKENLLNNLKQLNTAIQKGMIEKFDSTIGRGTVLMPFGGKYQLTENEVSIQKLPTEGFTNTASAMAVGYNPNIAAYLPYLGAIYSVVEALAKLVSIGVDYKGARLTNQEYFERLGEAGEKWGKPAQALLGLLKAQLEMETPSIGGKDSMSGTFNDIDVPPTLITFAINTVDVNSVISPEFKSAGNYIYLLKAEMDEKHEPDFAKLRTGFDALVNEINNGNVVSASVVKHGGIAEGIAKMAFGNRIGAEIETDENLFVIMPGSILVESSVELDAGIFKNIGKTTELEELVFNGVGVKIDEAIKASVELFEDIYPIVVEQEPQELDTPLYTQENHISAKSAIAKPKVLVPIVPGTNSEYDVIKAFEAEGADVETFILNTLNEAEYDKSIKEMAKAIASSQILALVGGFANGDEPDGCAVLLTNVLRNEHIKWGIGELLANDGLILGISNGFQALVKSGLLPYGRVTESEDNGVTIFKNNINRNVSKIVNTRISSNKSPWMSSFVPGEIHSLPFSQTQGKVVIEEDLALELIKNGQIAAQYVNEEGMPTLCGRYNPSASMYAIEAMTNEDGRILGKMGHSERYEDGLLKNISGNKEQNIFRNAVEYFKK